MSCSDEKRPAVANVSQNNGEALKGKAKEVVKNSQVEKMEIDGVEGVPKPVPRAGEEQGSMGGKWKGERGVGEAQKC